MALQEINPTVSELGTLRILDAIFGSTVNSKGYKELNPKVGVIYGDGMYFDRYKDILETMEKMGYANTNLVIGVGGLLLQQHNRDDLGFAFKATYAEINGESVELYKDPVTDPGKKSHKGLMKLTKNDEGEYVTLDLVSAEAEKDGELVQVFKDGKVTKRYTLDEIRERAKVL
jgi:nicotinamide phosphoribosyltransferase